jgi:hypothetical protein
MIENKYAVLAADTLKKERKLLALVISNYSDVDREYRNLHTRISQIDDVLDHIGEKFDTTGRFYK